jgi:hypothetical protein
LPHPRAETAAIRLQPLKFTFSAHQINPVPAAMLQRKI